MYKLNRTKILWAFGVISVLVVIVKISGHNLFNMHSKNTKRILVLLASMPHSSDPLEYDSFTHHVAFGSIYGNLVSQYKLGEHTPEIAKSWVVNSTFTEWTFKIRENLTFSDGSPITSQSVLSSWLRMAKLMKGRGSNSGFFENIAGYDQLNNSSENIRGLVAKNGTLTIILVKPMPRLLDKISFGLYAIVHPSQFDYKSGNWTAGRENLISSGPYKIIEWTDNQLILILRKEYPTGLRHSKPIEELEFFWKKETHPDSEIDIAMGSELARPPNQNLMLQAGPPSYIFFMRTPSWRDPKNFFHKKESRIVFRNEFYKQLEGLGVKPIRSFFPLIIRGTSELKDSRTTNSIFAHHSAIRISTYTQPTFPNLLFNQSVNASVQAAQVIGFETERVPINFNVLFKQITSEQKKTSWDIVYFYTGILAAEPLDDVKFMFKSKEGILLPDETGEILKELDKKPVNLQRINELLWEQGLIWPVTHYSSGLWARPDLDFSQINLVLPPTSFQWIGWK